MVIFSPCPIVGAPVRPNMPNMPKSASVVHTSPLTSSHINHLQHIARGDLLEFVGH